MGSKDWAPVVIKLCFSVDGDVQDILSLIPWPTTLLSNRNILLVGTMCTGSGFELAWAPDVIKFYLG